MVDVLMTSPACAAEPTGMYARVNDILRYHRQAGASDVNIDVAAISWDGAESPEWANERIHPPSGSRLRRVVKMLLTLISRRDADVVHVTNFLPYVNWLYPLLATNKPLIVGPNNTGGLFPPTMLSDETLDQIRVEKGSLLRRWKVYGERFERLRLRACANHVGGPTRFVAQSNFARRILVERGVDDDTISVLPSGVCADVFTPDGPAVEWPGEGDGLRLLFVGKPTRRKGIHVLADAVQTLSTSDETVTPSVVVLGSDEPPPFLRGHPAGDAVQFAGRVARKALPKYYRSADAFVTPSFYEAEPTVMIEALACGTPVIATDAEPFTEIGSPNTCRYFERGRAAQLAEVLSDFQPAACSKAARKRADEYDIGRAYERLIRTYRALT